MPTTPDPTYSPAAQRTLRVLAAIGIELPVLAMLVFRIFSPAPGQGAAGVTGYFATHPGVHQGELVVSPVIAALALLGGVAMGGLALRRSPWLAISGAALTVAGWSTIPMWVGQDNLSYLIGRAGADPRLLALWDRFNTSDITNVYLTIFIVGHLIGPLLLGLALRRAGVVRAWVPILIALSVPLHVLAFVTGTGYLDPIGYAMLAAAMVPATIAAIGHGQ